jgi:centromere/kinetochore protein ZW10
LNNHLSILKRDLTTHFFDHVLKGFCSVAVYTDISKQAKLSCVPSSSSEPLSSRLTSLTTILDFLHDYLFPHLPSSHWLSFSRSLRNVLSNSILDNLLRPSLPPAFDGLSSYLLIVQQAVEFEEKYIVGILGGDVNDKAIQLWTRKLSSHYERQRRVQILNLSRTIILALDSAEVDFLEDIDMLSESVQPSDIHMQEVSLKDEGENSGSSTGYSEEAWGFGDDEKSGNGGSATVDEDSWGFEDDTAEPEVTSDQHTVAENEPQSQAEGVEQDPGDAWGWNEDNNIPVEDSGDDSAWDDPWAEAPSSEQSEEFSVAEGAPAPVPSISQPKVASRLEKLAAKHKKPASTDPMSSSPLKHSVTSSFQSVTESRETVLPHAGTESLKTRPFQLKKTSLAKESYRVSGRMKQLLRLVEDVISEGKHLSWSKVLPSSSSTLSLGTIILQSAPSALDLFRGLYPVKHARDLESADKAMAFSNDCLYMSSQVERLLAGPAHDVTALKDKFEECKSYFKVLSESWYYDTIVRPSLRLILHHLVDDLRKGKNKMWIRFW